VWPYLASAWSAHVKGGGKPLADTFRKFAENDRKDENGYAVYLSVQCRDATWPRDWSRWRSDMTALHRVAPFLTWPNAWYNAPCAFWSVRGGTPVPLKAAQGLPPILMLQARGDAATPYQGALAMRTIFPSARLVEEGGGNHGISLAGNACVDRHLARYLEVGRVPGGTERRPKGAETRCPGLPDPKATVKMSSGSAGHLRLSEIIGR
jgi:hypothetical protein